MPPPPNKKLQLRSIYVAYILYMLYCFLHVLVQLFYSILFYFLITKYEHLYKYKKRNPPISHFLSLFLSVLFSLFPVLTLNHRFSYLPYFE